MKGRQQIVLMLFLSMIVCVNLIGCKFFKKKIPPNELFTNAETLRKNDEHVEAAKHYDELFELHGTSELAPAALYYSGVCKYTLSLQCPGKQTFEQQKDELSKLKREQYQQCITYMDKHEDSFLYAETLDKYLYKGTEFDKLIEQYPSSDLVDDAAFQWVRAQIIGKQTLNTITIASVLQFYGEFFQQYSQSPYRQHVIKDVLELLADSSDPLDDHPAIVESYKIFVPFRDDFPEIAQLSHWLGKRFIEEGDLMSAADVLGLPSIVGIGIVDTKRTGLNIRRGQGTQYQIVGKAEKGEELLVLESTGQWYSIQLQNGTLGYAHSDYIKLLQE